MSGSEEMPVGIVVERRKIDSPWQDYVWNTVAVLPGAPQTESWRELEHLDRRVRFFAGVLPVQLYSRYTPSYRDNMMSTQPQVYVVLREAESGAPHPWRPYLATVAPDEAQAHSESGQEIVDAVPMPEIMMAWLEAFIARYHVDTPVYKRQRKPYDPRKGGPERAPPGFNGKARA